MKKKKKKKKKNANVKSGIFLIDIPLKEYAPFLCTNNNTK